MSTKSEIDRAMELSLQIMPKHHPETTCFIVQSIVAGMRGLTMKHIRLGALFWPAKMIDNPYLSMRGGWGCEGYSVHDDQLFLSEEDIDDDGGFRGHTWLEPDDGESDVIDLMHDNEGSMREIYDENFNKVGMYIPRRKLERNVKRYWGKEMRAAIKLGAETLAKIEVTAEGRT